MEDLVNGEGRLSVIPVNAGTDPARPSTSSTFSSPSTSISDLELNGTPTRITASEQRGYLYLYQRIQHRWASVYPDAIARGASLIVCEQECQPGLPSIRVTDTRKAAALLARLYFNCPSSSFRLVGVTGTNGKTSTSLIIFEALRRLGYKAGWIGTLGYMINDGHFPTGHIHRILWN
jgi:UDP-N-acetylmuramate-alanine ligase